MHDIRLALGLIGFLSLGIFLALRRLLAKAPPRALDAIAVGLVLLMAAYLKYVWGQLWIVNWIPLSSVIVLANWFPLMLAAMAAVVWLRLDGDSARVSEETAPRDDSESGVSHDRRFSGDADQKSQSFGNRTLVIRRTVLMLAIASAAVWSELYFIPTSPPVCEDRWDPPIFPLPWKVCRQTHDSTCSAAAAATILATLNIETTEQEMARLCLTRNGTTWLGLYHGLTTKLQGTNYRVEFFEGAIADLPQLAEQHPLLLCCRLDAAAAEELPEYEFEGGWIRGTAHSVVYFGQINGFHIIGDPSRGYEAWRDRDLKILWTRQGLRITDKSPATVAAATSSRQQRMGKALSRHINTFVLPEGNDNPFLLPGKNDNSFLLPGEKVAGGRMRGRRHSDFDRFLDRVNSFPGSSRGTRGTPAHGTTSQQDKSHGPLA